MKKPKHFAPGAAGKKEGKKAWVIVSRTDASTAASRAAGEFIPRPTREQLMAGSANLRRVYKTEA